MVDKDKSIKDKSYNDVKANAKRVTREAKESVVEHVEDVKDSVEDHVENVEERFSNVTISQNQKLALTAGVVLVASVAVQSLINRFRKVRVVNVVTPVVVEVDPNDVEG